MPEAPKRPLIGMRNIKTATAAALCVLLYAIIDRNPTFACIGAVFGMGSDLNQSKLHGGNRFFGTMIGGFMGMALFTIYRHLSPVGENTLLLVLLTFVGVVALIVICQFVWIGGVQPGGVILCVIMFNTPVESYIPYTLNRIVDSGIGVLIALLVNSMLPGGFTFPLMKKIYQRIGLLKDEEQDSGLTLAEEE